MCLLLRSYWRSESVSTINTGTVMTWRVSSHVISSIVDSGELGPTLYTVESLYTLSNWEQNKNCPEFY